MKQRGLIWFVSIVLLSAGLTGLTLTNNNPAALAQGSTFYVVFFQDEPAGYGWSGANEVGVGDIFWPNSLKWQRSCK